MDEPDSRMGHAMGTLEGAAERYPLRTECLNGGLDGI